MGASTRVSGSLDPDTTSVNELDYTEGSLRRPRYESSREEFRLWEGEGSRPPEAHRIGRDRQNFERAHYRCSVEDKEVEAATCATHQSYTGWAHPYVLRRYGCFRYLRACIAEAIQVEGHRTALCKDPGAALALTIRGATCGPPCSAQPILTQVHSLSFAFTFPTHDRHEHS